MKWLVSGDGMVECAYSSIPPPGDWANVSPSAETHACEFDVGVLVSDENTRISMLSMILSCFSCNRQLLECVGSRGQVGLSSALLASVVRLL